MKKVGILGTGNVGSTIGSKMISLGYEVKMGSRSKENEKALAWVKSQGVNASNGTFEDTAIFADILFNCTRGDSSLDVFKMAGIQHFNHKIIIDISNPLDFSKGMPPSLIPAYSNIYSLGEAIQDLLPASFVVKTLNMVNCEVMVNPSKSGGDPTMFLSGNDIKAKEEVKSILNQFGWSDMIDLGDISTARGTEMLLPIWLRTWMATGNGYFAFKIVR